MTQHPLVQLADIIHLNTDRVSDPASAGIDRFVGLEHIEPENLHIRRWGNVADGTTFTNTFKRGQVLFGKRRAYQRKVAVADFDGVCSSDIYVFESKDPNMLLPELVPFILQSEGFYQYAVKTSAGSLSPRTNWTHLANYELNLPPVDEQRRIADLLWAISDSQVSLEETKDSAVRLFSSLLHETTKPLSHWNNTTLGKVARIDINRVKVVKGEKYRMCGVLGFGQGVFENGIADSKSTKYKLLHRLTFNQLVLRKITAWESPIAIVTPEFDGYFVSPEFPTFTLDTSQLLPSFMRVLYKTKQFTREMQARCTGTLVRRMRLNPNELLKIPVSIPPLDEQKEIVAKVEALQDTINSLEQHITSTKKLMKLTIEKSLGGK